MLSRRVFSQSSFAEYVLAPGPLPHQVEGLSRVSRNIALKTSRTFLVEGSPQPSTIGTCQGGQPIQQS